MIQINAYAGFNGNCHEAMTFYKECLGGELTMQVIGESPIAGQFPAAMQDKILHSYDQLQIIVIPIIQYINHYNSA